MSVVQVKGSFGTLSEHALGLILKEWGRRAMVISRQMREEGYDSHAKADARGEMTDVVTEIDIQLQKLARKWAEEMLPGWGVIGEEDSLRVEGTLPGFVVVDPLDGTKALARNDISGTAFVVALVWEGVVIAVMAVDINSGEYYTFRPFHSHVYKGIGSTKPKSLVVPEVVDLKKVRVVLRGRSQKHSPMTQQVIRQFKDWEEASGSIFLSMCRYFRGVFGAAILPKGTQKPWDFAPFYGMIDALGLKCYMVSDEIGRLIEWQPTADQLINTWEMDFDLLIAHPSVAELLQAEFQIVATAA